MKRSLLLLIVAGCLFWSSGAEAQSPSADKGNLLRQAMAEITLLRSQLAERKMDAATIRDNLAGSIARLSDEVRQALQGKNMRNGAAAISKPDTWHNLRLIGELAAYSERYAKKIRDYRVAENRLDYLYQQADDDLKIVNTLSDMKIDALLTQIRRVLLRYNDEGQTIILGEAALVPVSPETIWRERFAAK